MDDLLAALPGFDPETPLHTAPEPWDYLPMPRLRIVESQPTGNVPTKSTRSNSP